MVKNIGETVFEFKCRKKSLKIQTSCRFDIGQNNFI